MVLNIKNYKKILTDYNTNNKQEYYIKNNSISINLINAYASLIGLKIDVKSINENLFLINIKK